MTFCIFPFVACQSDMSSTAFIEPLPVIDFVAQILDKDVFSRPLSDADRVKVLYSMVWELSGFVLHIEAILFTILYLMVLF